MATASGWKTDARKTRLGPEVKLQTLGGKRRFRPCKWSVEATDQIRELQNSVYFAPEHREKLKALSELRDKLKAEGKGIEEASYEQLRDLTPEIPLPIKLQIYRLALLHGVGDHDFRDETGALIGGGDRLDAETVEEILAWADLAKEMYAPVEAWNRPLASPTSTTS